MLKPAINLLLMTDGICNLRCPGCPGGRREYNPGRMSLEMAQRVIDKAAREATVILCNTFVYNEPFLHPDAVGIAKCLQDHGINAVWSTNLNVWKHVPSILATVPRTLIISVSGFTQPIYERYHVGGNIERVKTHMLWVSRLRRRGTFVRVVYHQHDYNRHEEPLMREYAESLGFTFTPYGCSVLGLNRVKDYWRDGTPIPGMDSYLAIDLERAHQLCLARKHWSCYDQDYTLEIDCNGDAILCGSEYHAANPKFSFLTHSVREVLEWKHKHPYCKACKETGAHIYLMQEYERPDNWVKKIEELYKRLGLRRWPWLTNQLSERLFSRPKGYQ